MNPRNYYQPVFGYNIRCIVKTSKLAINFDKNDGYGGVATRRGAFCAHPYVWRLMGIPEEQLNEFEECSDVNTPGMIRISFGIYNTEEEVDRFLEMLPEMIETAKYEVETKYSRAEPAY